VTLVIPSIVLDLGSWVPGVDPARPSGVQKAPKGLHHLSSPSLSGAFFGPQGSFWGRPWGPFWPKTVPWALGPLWPDEPAPPPWSTSSILPYDTCSTWLYVDMLVVEGPNRPQRALRPALLHPTLPPQGRQSPAWGCLSGSKRGLSRTLFWAIGLRPFQPGPWPAAL
jgi:hypothetical protein